MNVLFVEINKLNVFGGKWCAVWERETWKEIERERERDNREKNRASTDSVGAIGWIANIFFSFSIIKNVMQNRVDLESEIDPTRVCLLPLVNPSKGMLRGLQNKCIYII